MAGYSFLDRLLHRLALQALPIAELSFDLDQRLVDSSPAQIVSERHVFVSGLARAGTTVLMRRFYATGAYRSLTYRDMPFVLAPNLWRKLAGTSGREVAAAERAHGDRILVDFDSPESLDEVFWRVFAGDEYISRTHLSPHTPSPETTEQYVRYVNAVLNTEQPRATRYLCKNNNNVLRLGALRQAFPKALILIPFRDPVTQAVSLLRQHRNFLTMQAEDTFVRSYMTWLVHHEFGQDHRPFIFGEQDPAEVSVRSSDTLEYWLVLWYATYGWLEHAAPENAIFICYEDLCTDPEVWEHLAALAEIPATAGAYTPFSAPASERCDGEAELLTQIFALHARLVKKSRAALGGPSGSSRLRRRGDPAP